MLDEIKKTIMAGVVFIAIIGASFLGGYLTCKFVQSPADNTAIVAKYEARLAGIANVNRELQKANRRIADANSRITKRLDSAKAIIDGINGQLESDGDTIQRIIEKLSQLEQAISIIFENWTPKE